MRFAALAFLLAGCGHGTPREQEPPDHIVVADAAAPSEDLMTITSSEQIAGQDDQIVHVVGLYLVQNLGRYRIVSTQADGTEIQSNKLSYLQLTDGGTVRLGARPAEELPKLTEQRVIVTGRMREKWPPPDPTGRMAQPDPKPTLIEISEIRISPGS